MGNLFKTIISGLVGIGVLISGGIFFKSSLLPQSSIQELNSEISKPWIEVLAPQVFELNSEKKPIRELQTGDEVTNEATIDVRKNARANIYFPDGSITRLDSETTITLEYARYDPTQETLVVKIFLSTGRIWSKVIALVTPESEWQVKTSNAVATVRGTAFGMEYKKGRSSVIGSEHNVRVAAVDPKTKKVLENLTVNIEPKTFVWIEDQKISDLQKTKKPLEIQKTPDEIANDPWVKNSEAEDIKIEKAINSLREKKLEDKRVREEFRKDVLEKFKDAIERRKREHENTLRDEELLRDKEDLQSSQKASSQEQKSAETSELIEKPTDTITVSAPSSVLLKPKDLSIIVKNSLANVSEGQQLLFEAVITFTDGTRKVITDSAAWQVIGPIGKIIKPGVFEARLDPSVAEFGIAPGSIVASWKDPATGEVMINKTSIFNVTAKVEELLDTRG